MNYKNNIKYCVSIHRRVWGTRAAETRAPTPPSTPSCSSCSRYVRCRGLGDMTLCSTAHLAVHRFWDRDEPCEVAPLQ